MQARKTKQSIKNTLTKDLPLLHAGPGNTTNCGMGLCTDGTIPIESGDGALKKDLLGLAELGQEPQFEIIGGAVIRGNHIYNGIPVVDNFIQATSKVHDWFIGSALGRYTAQGTYIPFGTAGGEAAFNVFGNFGTMLPAAAYTAGAMASGNAAAVDAARMIK
ncbi:MAG: hypothetical protein MRJ96_13630 [Nitrospirales bacterium]|nr:hypothetical protein [Nitrospira sp.]MDR4502485.1 hypothetical protein [Nitrospirales bacterium]